MKKSILFLAISFFSLNSYAQLFIDTTFTAEQMVMDFFDGECVTVSNINSVEGGMNMAYFEAANTNMGINAGIILSTGSTLIAGTPNTAPNSTGETTGIGDTDLETYYQGIGDQSFDAAVLEFDIYTENDSIDFSYIFASEEYPEYVASMFNDVFAFFISGPGIDGLQNIALIPGTDQYVSIHNVNDNSYNYYYNTNLNSTEFTYDAYTDLFPAPFYVTPFETYHIKLVIADVGDAMYDSAVFLGVESLCGDSLLVPPAEMVVEQTDNTVSFTNDSRYATSWYWDFGDGTFSTDRYPAPHTYADDGVYEITLTTTNYCCTDETTYSVTIGNPSNISSIAQNPFSLSPNPVQEELFISFDENLTGTIEIIDIQGRIQLQNSFSGDISLDLSLFSAGIYTLRVVSENKIYTQKIIK